jgi:hypothetical protein
MVQTALLGFVMFMVTIVFFLNTLNAYDKVSTKECGLWCTIIASILLIIDIYGILTGFYGDATYWWAGQSLLFALTYFMMGLGILTKIDMRGLGWFCLLVSLYCPVIISQSFGDIRMVIIWIVWMITWFVFFLELGLQKVSIAKWFRHVQWVVLVGTLFIPGLMMLNGWW